jgi:hypothetical protein
MMETKKGVKKSKPIGKCPYCDGTVFQREIQVSGKKVKLYSCSNMKVAYDEGDQRFLQTEESSCTFRVFSNALLKYNKKSISEKEIKQLISGEQQIAVRLYSKKLYDEKKEKYGKEYFRYVIPDINYGVSVLFDIEVDEKDLF